MTSAQFSSTFDSYADEGLRSLDFEAIETGGGMRYAGIWTENRSGRGWYLYRDLTANGYRNRWNQLYDKGYRLDNFEKYDTPSGIRYSGIWRQNTSRPNWPLRADVDAAVKSERDEFDVPGIGVAIAHDGKLVYLGGVGDQDVADDVWMHSGSVNRIASVSKAVTGALAMRMVAQHPSLDLDDPIQDYLPQLPAHHTYTVRQALMNRSCLVHYPAGMSSQNQTQYDSSLEVLETFADQPLGCTPGQYLYSTYAYNAPAGVFEGLEGTSFDQIAFNELTVPFGLTTLRTENLAGSLDRATLYETDNDEYDGDNTSNKYPGGGFVSSSRDLTRFGMGILDGTILSEDQREEMWDPIGSYAMGWDVGTADGGQRVVGKSGGQPGAKAYLRIYPDDGIVISVLSNRQGGGHSASALSREIGEQMLAELLTGLDRGVDGEGASRPRHRHAVVPVAHGVAVADADHADRRQRDAAVLGQPQPLPAAASQARGPELAVEQLGAARLDRAGDRVERDLEPRRQARAAALRLVVDREAPEPPCQRGTAAGAPLPSERPLGVHLC